MVQTGPAGPGDSRGNASYASQWNHFVAWADASGRRSLPASTDDVADYLKSKWESGTKFSTLKVAVAAIARTHKEAGFAAPFHGGVANSALIELTGGDVPVAARALPLDLDCYLAIRKTAYEPRRGRGGRPETEDTARRRGALDIAMIGLMRDARLRLSEAAVLTWEDVEPVSGGTGRVRVETGGEPDYRVVTSDTMRLMSAIRREAADSDPVLGLRPNQISKRIGSAVRQAGLGEGYSGESPRLGMIRDLQNIGVLLVGDHLADREK